MMDGCGRTSAPTLDRSLSAPRLPSRGYRSLALASSQTRASDGLPDRRTRTRERRAAGAYGNVNVGPLTGCCAVQLPTEGQRTPHQHHQGPCRTPGPTSPFDSCCGDGEAGLPGLQQHRSAWPRSRLRSKPLRSSRPRPRPSRRPRMRSHNSRAASSTGPGARPLAQARGSRAPSESIL